MDTTVLGLGRDDLQPMYYKYTSVQGEYVSVTEPNLADSYWPMNVGSDTSVITKEAGVTARAELCTVNVQGTEYRFLKIAPSLGNVFTRQRDMTICDDGQFTYQYTTNGACAVGSASCPNVGGVSAFWPVIFPDGYLMTDGCAPAVVAAAPPPSSPSPEAPPPSPRRRR